MRIRDINKYNILIILLMILLLPRSLHSSSQVPVIYNDIVKEQIINKRKIISFAIKCMKKIKKQDYLGLWSIMSPEYKKEINADDYDKLRKGIDALYGKLSDFKGIDYDRKVLVHKNCSKVRLYRVTYSIRTTKSNFNNYYVAVDIVSSKDGLHVAAIHYITNMNARLSPRVNMDILKTKLGNDAYDLLSLVSNYIASCLSNNKQDAAKLFDDNLNIINSQYGPCAFYDHAKDIKIHDAIIANDSINILLKYCNDNIKKPVRHYNSLVNLCIKRINGKWVITDWVSQNSFYDYDAILWDVYDLQIYRDCNDTMSNPDYYKNVSDDITKPIPLKKYVTPYYSGGGMVIITMLIRKDGSIGKLIVNDAPNKSLAKVAVGFAKKWKFKPATRNGKPVTAFYTVTFKFEK